MQFNSLVSSAKKAKAVALKPYFFRRSDSKRKGRWSINPIRIHQFRASMACSSTTRLQARWHWTLSLEIDDIFDRACLEQRYIDIHICEHIRHTRDISLVSRLPFIPAADESLVRWEKLRINENSLNFSTWSCPAAAAAVALCSGIRWWSKGSSQVSPSGCY